MSRSVYRRVAFAFVIATMLTFVLYYPHFPYKRNRIELKLFVVFFSDASGLHFYKVALYAPVPKGDMVFYLFYLMKNHVNRYFPLVPRGAHLISWTRSGSTLILNLKRGLSLGGSILWGIAQTFCINLNWVRKVGFEVEGIPVGGFIRCHGGDGP